MSREQITIGIVTYNNANTIMECLRSISAQKIPAHIIVLDNCSNDETVSLVRGSKIPLQLRLSSENHGFAHAYNTLLQEATQKKSEYFLVLNPDAHLQPHALKALCTTAKKHDNRALVGPLIYADRACKDLWGSGGGLDKKRFSAHLLTQIPNEYADAQDYPTTFISGTCMLIPCTLFEKLRFFEPYFMYYEDVEYSLKAKQLGYPSIIAAHARITHVEQSELPAYQGRKNYYLSRNHLLFVERNASLGIRLREFIRLPKTIYEELSKSAGISGIKDYLFRQFGRYGKN